GAASMLTTARRLTGTMTTIGPTMSDGRRTVSPRRSAPGSITPCHLTRPDQARAIQLARTGGTMAGVADTMERLWGGDPTVDSPAVDPPAIDPVAAAPGAARLSGVGAIP